MKKKNKNPVKPRYITIRIQYYPITKEIILLLICIVSLFIFSHLPSQNFKESKKETHKIPVQNSYFVNKLLQRTDILVQTRKDIHFNGERVNKQIALTFDADMTPGMELQLQYGEVESYYNKAVIDILNKTDTKATLFLTGMWIETYSDAAKDFAHNPLFELGSHSYSHPSFDGFCYGLSEISDDQDDFQLQKTQVLLKNLTGFDNLYFRFPGGCYSKKDLHIVEKNKLLAIQWDVAGDDGFNYDTESIIHNVIDRVQNGSIIVLHMHGGPNAPKTADALPTIIKTLKEKGFVFVTISELLINNNFHYKFTNNINW